MRSPPPPRLDPVGHSVHAWWRQIPESRELLANRWDPLARGPVGARPGSRRAASCAARKGVTAGALIFLGFRSPLQFARPKGLFVLSGEVSAEERATSRGSTLPLWFSERMPALLRDLCLSSSWYRAARVWEEQSLC